MVIKKNSLLQIIFISLFSFHYSIRKTSDVNDSQFKSQSHFYSQVVTSSNFNGKPESHIKSLNIEEFRSKKNDEPLKIRKFSRTIKKDNDNNAEMHRKASSNVEEEGMVVNGAMEKKFLSKDEEKKVISKGNNFPFEKDFYDFFDDKYVKIN
jgi:hypothetical protein